MAAIATMKPVGGKDAAHEALTYYLIETGGADFPLQHMVDAFAAETADRDTRPITLTFALAGLYLYLEQGYSGAEVQRAHTAMARARRAWPVLALPDDRGEIGIVDVMTAPAGGGRDAAMRTWCAAVWQAYHAHQATIRELVASLLPAGVKR